jgi:hypothetical protein
MRVSKLHNRHDGSRHLRAMYRAGQQWRCMSNNQVLLKSANQPPDAHARRRLLNSQKPCTQLTMTCHRLSSHCCSVTVTLQQHAATGTQIESAGVPQEVDDAPMCKQRMLQSGCLAI